MARNSEGWSLTRDRRTGVYTVRFTHAGRRQHRSTRARDLAGAQVEAARIYAETISGRRLQARTEPLRELDVLFAEWLSQIESEIAPETWKTYQGYCSNHFLPFFESADRITASSAEDYSRKRLRAVTRSTVAKELSALRNFLNWAERRHEIDEAPLVRNPPRRSTGTAFKGGKRDKVRVSLTSEQAEAIIDFLPDRTPVAGHPIKALFTVIWDTSLRIGTMWRLEVPKHYKRRDDVLRISQEIDKSRYARSVPLTPRARRVLDAICPEEGLIFRHFEYRRILLQAARQVLGTEHEAKHLSAHDFRHAALTHMAAVGSDLTAIGHIAGHKNATTTALYVHNSEAAARRAVARRAGILDTEVDTVAGQAAEMHPVARLKSSESLGGPSWTRTRSQWIKNAPRESERPGFFNDSEGDIGSREATKRPETTLFGHGVQHENRVKPMSDVHWAATGLLHRVADGGEIPMAVLREFAELVLHSELVAGARAVLDGPPEFAVRRALELASVVLAVGVGAEREQGKEGTK